MTTPAAPAPAAAAPEAPAAPAAPAAVMPPPAAPAAPSAPAPAAPVAPEAPKPNNLPDDVPALHAMVTDLRRENAAARTAAKAQAAEEARNEVTQSLGKLLGFVKDDAPIDQATLTAGLTTAQAEAKQARVELAVYRTAAASGGDPARLLEHKSFLKSLDSVDPTDDAAVTAAIASAVTANPWLGATPEVRTPAPTPGQGAGGAGAVDLQTQLAEATKAGDHLRAIAIRQAIAVELKK